MLPRLTLKSVRCEQVRVCVPRLQICSWSRLGIQLQPAIPCVAAIFITAQLEELL